MPNRLSRSSEVMWSQLFLDCCEEGLNLQSRIRQMMVTAILDQQLPPCTSLTSCRKLAEQLGVARNTVVLAYQQLADEGFIIPRERSGYFVNPEILEGRIDLEAPPPSTNTPTRDWSSRFRFKPSSQRNIEKNPNWQNYPYPFIYGQFDASLFPTADWRECCRKGLGVMEIRDWAPDHITRDDSSLVEQIRTRVLPRRGLRAAADEIVVTIGAQQALYLLADLLVTAQTTVGVEDPGYPDARNIFASRTSRTVGLGVDEQGLVPDGPLRDCDYVYVTPSHQCPTTATMPLERRQELLRIAEEEDIILFEDDYETENCYSGKPKPALKSLDQNGRVVYIGSLSKSFAPGLRLGYIVGSKELISEVRALRRLMVRHPATFIQRSFSLFLSLGHHDSLTRRLSQIYNRRAHVLTDALSRHLPQVTFEPVSGGASCWVHGPKWLDCRQLAQKAEERGVLIERGDVFFMMQDAPVNHFRIGFSSIPEERIEQGIRELGAVINELEPQSGRTFDN